ncbi:hypothetical protein ACFV85_15005 [Streptomyces niveus]|uniref:hypothetical protein n=1 Tax=Streptomyces niveus TaxID=193462 RepID=UPI0036580AF1
MAFPQDRSAPRVAMAFGADLTAHPNTWEWTTLPDADLLSQQITITGGRANESAQPGPRTVSLSLDNPHGNYTPDNPMSEHWPNLTLGTPCRASWQAGAPHLALDGTPTAYASTPDHVSLDITGDLELRIEFTGDVYGPVTQNLIGKWSETGNQRAYLLQLTNSGLLRMLWSADGTAAGASSYTLPLPPALPRRVALRAALDVDDGAGGWLVRMYWAPSLAGPWVRFGAEFAPGVGPTGVASTTAPLRMAPSTPLSTNPGVPVDGEVFAAEVRNGSGTVVASPDFTAQAPGAASFVDSTGKTWTLNGTAEITDWQHRFVGNVDEWLPTWPYGDLSDQDRGQPGESRVSVVASGILRRLGQGQKALDSTLRRRVPSAPGLIAYWPMEDAREAQSAFSPTAGVGPLRVAGVDFAADDTLAGSSALPKLKNPATLTGSVPRSNVSGWQVELVYFLPTLPAAQTEILRVNVGGSTARSAHVYVSNAGVRIEARDADGEILAFFLYSGAPALAAFYGAWNRLSIHVSDEGGGGTRLTATWRDINGSGGRSYSSTVFTGAMGYVAGVSGTWGAATEGMALGHLGVMAVPGSGTNPGSVYYDGADDGYNGETAGARIQRLCSEEAIPVVITGAPSTTMPMGPQRPGKLLDVLGECAAADGGILGEQRRTAGLQYRPRATLYNQPVALVLDAGNNEIVNPFAPVLDDKEIRNDVQTSRSGGSAARVVDAASMAASGVYDEQITVNVYTDDQLPNIAAWRLHLGTWPGMRYPSLSTELAIAPQLIADWLPMDSGDRAHVINLPPQHPTDAVDVLVQGYSETLSPTRWTLSLNCTPAGPWTVGVLEHPELSRADSAGSMLAAEVDAVVTVLLVTTARGPQWVDASMLWEFPFDVRVGGEVVRVEQITGQVQDTFARTVATGWGTATSGQAWTTSGGSASDYSVQGA